MRARRILGAIGSMCLAAGSALAQAPTVGPALTPPASGPQTLMPVAPGPGMLPQAGMPGLQSPPGRMGLEAYPGPGPQEGGAQLGTHEGQIPGVPQAWAMSAFNPAPRMVIRTEAMFLKSDFPRSDRLALQTEVSSTGAFSIEDKVLGLDNTYILTPRLTAEWFGPLSLNSFEIGGWANIGPHRTSDLGNRDFPYFLGPFTDPTTGATIVPLTGVPGSFPAVADRATWDFSQRIGNVEFMWWRHHTPEKGAVSDCAVGVGGRYLWMHEKIDLTYEDLLPSSPTPSGTLTSQAKNDLFGVQIAAKATLQSPWRRVRTFLEGKIGLMNNDARLDAIVSDPTGELANARWVRSNFSPIFEGNLNMEWFVTQYVTAYAGFNVIYIDRMERASEQFNQDFNVFVSPQKNQSDVLLFGPKLGFVMTW